MTVRMRDVCVSLMLLSALIAARGGVMNAAQQPEDSDGWQLPTGAAAEANPVPVTPAALAKGKDLYKSKCQKCHGPSGKGDGPDADKDHKPGDLTDSKRASRNPDGVMFYKIWNGRSKPKMPAFKTDISRADVWTVIGYVKTLRQ
ncbi:MAG: c-type cytochrome [Acidobacteriota bacterium]